MQSQLEYMIGLYFAQILDRSNKKTPVFHILEFRCRAKIGFFCELEKWAILGISDTFNSC